MKSFSAVFIAVIFMTAGCNQFDSPASDPSIVPAKKAAAVVDSSMTIAVGDSAVQLKNITTIAPEKAATLMPAAGLNPAHGQPGHRCDIAVGAPLNTQPATAPQPAAVSVPQAAPAADVQGARNVNPSAKLNPPHGQPGHDCAVPVGTPLKN